MRRDFVALFVLLAVAAQPAVADPLADFAAAERIADVPRFEATIAALRRLGHLPDGLFATKSAAEARGWRPGQDLCATLPGESIGGDRFDNRERLLPPDRVYHEADLDYHCGPRAATRLVYDAAGHQWVTIDHYRSFQAVP